MPVLPKTIYSFNVVPIKFQAKFYTGKLIIKFM